MKICCGLVMGLQVINEVDEKNHKHKHKSFTGAEADFRNKLGVCLGDVCVADSVRTKFPFQESHFWNDGRMKSSGWKTWLTHPSPSSTRVPLSATKLSGFNVGPTEFIVLSESNAKKLRNAWVSGQKSIPKFDTSSNKIDVKTLSVLRWKKDDSPISFKQ